MIDQTFGTFRKKPVVIEAVQFTRRFAWPDWFHDAVSAKTITTHGTGKFADPGEPCFCEIYTLEGDMRGDEGDWIIKGVKGEIYPCKPDIFAMTYEVATPAPAQPERCPYCDDTGDVHSIDGEWRGRCTCEAGATAPAEGAKPC